MPISMWRILTLLIGLLMKLKQAMKSGSTQTLILDIASQIDISLVLAFDEEESGPVPWAPAGSKFTRNPAPPQGVEIVYNYGKEESD
ncbi:uncharacterized protein LOC110109596 [Dendrobium catenatum]|uniref:uncharacterized protein LOC110109596 n=1 Tax=Dendrobium catenatum TaxID=906689 RepID=UPI0009F437D2|nr:uncharacterized protein LOC110109596 [Dendrobium catenatum]